MQYRSAFLAHASLLALALVPSPLRAQATQHPGTDPHASAHDGLDIVVVGHPPTDFALLTTSAAISGDTLVTQQRGQIGEILNSLPGVSSTSFSPGASRPVLRGFSGDRVSVLTDGIGSLDASNVSVDHAVVFDPLTVDHIDVFHGPSVLLLGGNAIGGAVNALDRRIPRRVPGNIEATTIASYGTAASERAMSGAIDVPLGDRLVAHVDANWRKSDDLRVGGHVLSRHLRSELLDEAAAHRAAGDAEEADELTDLAGLSGKIPNTAARSLTLGAGLAFIDAVGNLGISVQRFDTRYGIPERPGAAHGSENEDPGSSHGEDPVSIDLVQTRADLRSELRLGGLFESVQVRGAFADYRHAEMEGNQVGTRFAGNGIEFRADLVQARRGGWRGRSGVQYLTRKLAVAGDEAVVPDYQIDRIGVFTLQSLELGNGFEAEAALRHDSSKVGSAEGHFSHRYDLFGAGGGLSWKSPSGLGIGVNFVHGERAPSPEELLSDGLHVATQSYERGSRALGVEKSNGFEAWVRYHAGPAEASVTAYSTDFSNYIAPLATGENIEGMPVFQYSPARATFRGFEASGSWRVLESDRASLALDTSADYTRARLRNIGPVPRMPPLRLRGGIEGKLDALHLRGEVEWNAGQKRVAQFENRVSGFTVVNLNADWHPLGEDGPLTLIASADNLFDVVGRRAASFTRDFVPIAGRDLRLTAKLSF